MSDDINNIIKFRKRKKVEDDLEFESVDFMGEMDWEEHIETQVDINHDTIGTMIMEIEDLSREVQSLKKLVYKTLNLIRADKEKL